MSQEAIELLKAGVSAAAVAVFGLLIRLAAYWLKLRAHDRHEQRKLTAAPEVRALLAPPPEIPDTITKIITVLVLIFSVGIVAFAFVQHRRGPAPTPEEAKQPAVPLSAPEQQTAPNDEPDAAMAQSCETDSQCGAGCKCGAVTKQCRCAAFEKKGPVERKKKGKGGGTSSTPAGEVPRSGVAVRMEPMAGEMSTHNWPL